MPLPPPIRPSLQLVAALIRTVFFRWVAVMAVWATIAAGCNANPDPCESLALDATSHDPQFAASSDVRLEDFTDGTRTDKDVFRFRIPFVPEERVTTDDLNIEAISRWSMGYGNQFFCGAIVLNDVPTKKGETKVYSLGDVGIDFKRQTLTVTHRDSAVSNDIATLTPNDRFVGWARRGADALVIEKSPKGTMFVFREPAARTPARIELSGVNFRFLNSDRFLASVYTSDPCSGSAIGGPMVQFFNENGEKTEEVGWVIRRDARELEVYLKDMSTSNRAFVASISFPTEMAEGGASQHDVAISDDGTLIFFTLQARDWSNGTIKFALHYLLSLAENTIRKIDPRDVEFLSSPPIPTNQSSSGEFSTSFLVQEWLGSLKLRVTEKDEGFLFGNEEGTNAERLTYAYELHLESGSSEVKETGMFQLGYGGRYCAEGGGDGKYGY